MKVLITGATGLVGQELVALLLQKGFIVHYLTTSKAKLQAKANYFGFYWNPETGEFDVNALNNVSKIIHLAGASVAERWTANYKGEILNSRLKSTKLLFETLKNNENSVNQIITASAIGIYPSSLSKIYHETDTEIAPGFLGTVVQQWEEQVTAFEQLEITVAKIRTGIVLSNKGGALVEMAKSVKLGLGAALGSGNQYQSWIHIQDLVGIFLFVMEKNSYGIYNAVSPYPVTNQVLMKTIATTYKKPFFLPNVPEFILKLLLGDMYAMLVSSQNVSCKKILEQKFQFKFAALEKALQNLIIAK
jgi:uncharacterized protein (TIGR01777 family)